LTTIFKFDYNGDIRRFSRSAIINEALTFHRLQAIALESYPTLSSHTNHWYFYLDEEDDKITIANDRDITEFLVHADKSVATVKIFIRTGAAAAAGDSEGASYTPVLVSTPLSKGSSAILEPVSDSDEFVVINNHVASPPAPVVEASIDAPAIVHAVETHDEKSVSAEAPPSAPATTAAAVPASAASPPVEDVPLTFSERIEQLLRLFNLEHLTPLAVGWLELLRFTADERANYLLTVLADKRFVDFVAAYRESDAYKQLQASLAEVEETDVFDEATLERRISQVQATFIKPLLELFPELVIHFPILGADISVDDATSDTTPADDESVIHQGVTCDGCGVSPIAGPRFKCRSCRNFDFCLQCRHERAHDPTHPFEQIETPQPHVYYHGGARYGGSGYSGCHGASSRRGCGPCFSHFGFPGSSRCGYGRPTPPFPFPFPLFATGGCSRSRAPVESIPLVGLLSFINTAGRPDGTSCCGATTRPKETHRGEAPRPKTSTAASNSAVPDERTREVIRNDQAIKAAVEESLRHHSRAAPVSQPTKSNGQEGDEESKSQAAADPKELLVEKYGEKLEMLNTMGLCDDIDHCLTLLDQKNGDLRAVVEALFR